MPIWSKVSLGLAVTAGSSPEPPPIITAWDTLFVGLLEPPLLATADTAIGEIETSLGHVAGHINSLDAYQNTANALASIELESAAKLMDTNFALETAKLMKIVLDHIKKNDKN